MLALAQGYEDLNDHDALRDDTLLALAVGKSDLTGAQRQRARDRGHALAGKSTLNRLERTPAQLKPEERYKKIVYDAATIEELFTDDFIRAHPRPPEELVLGGAELGAEQKVATENVERQIVVAAIVTVKELQRIVGAGALEEVVHIVGQLRAAWPQVRITLRADSGFAREELMKWCEQHQVDVKTQRRWLASPLLRDFLMQLRMQFRMSHTGPQGE